MHFMMTRSRSLGVLFGGAVVLFASQPGAADPKSAPGRPAATPPRREVGNLIVDGVPDVPAHLAERAHQYQNVRSASFLDWDPDGKGMLVATRFAETAQIHHVESPGAYRQQITFAPEPVGSAIYHPALGGRGFIYQMDAGGNEFHQYYWFDRGTGARTLLTDGKSRNQSIRVARTGAKLAYASTRRNGTDFDIYTMEGADPGQIGKTVKLVKEVKGRWSPVDWSPDASQLLLERTVSINESYLHALDLATGQTVEINPTSGKKIAYGAAAYSGKPGGLFYSSDEDSEFLRLTHYDLGTNKKEVLTPSLAWDVTRIAVSPDGKWLAYVANEGGASGLYLAPAAGATRAAGLKPAKIELPKGVVSGIEFDRQSRRLGFSMSTAASSSDAYSIDVKTRKLTRWTWSEVGGLSATTFVTPELVEITTFDGRKIPSWYYRPTAAEPGTPAKPFPVIVSIHGGPESQAMAGFNVLVQYWVNELGAVVLQPNVRGSSGYGKSYLLLDDGMKREDAVKDIGKLLDWVATRPELDKDRVAVYGGSYGGYMVLSAMTHYADRLRCGVDIVGISNFVSFLEHTESYRRDARRAEYGDERDPAMRKFLLGIAPLTNARKIGKPLFVVQGKNDPRVPISEAEQIVDTVRKNGGQVWYLVAKDEGHGFQKKTNRDFLTNASTLFFSEHLLK